MYKILSHIYDPSAWSVYVDADIFLPDGMEEKLIEEVKQSGKVVGVFKHPWRDCVYDEAEEIVRLGKDVKENVEPMVEAFTSMNYPKHNGLAACGVLVRNNMLAMTMNNYWWAYLCSTSKRDQLSFPIAFKDQIHYFNGNIYEYKVPKR